ncbi:hypothetical protein [Micromonospora thermarum]|uniref:Uncharacterized protein n=1 Tax=Micromonospora thermarum TaxID=2720024 RepID=A0ABX0ZB72_9ACTN|nr:hypothetical protein [Micromonospora thermarum]NJP33724.1 hypothetical protein [Micromonospora thermarum]
MEQYAGAVHGQHKSAKVGAGAEKLRLVQAVAPWSTSVVLKVVDDHVLPLASFDLSTLGHYLAELRAVPSGPLTEQEMADARERAVRVLFPPVYGAEDPPRYLVNMVRELLLADQVDPLRAVARLREAFAVYTVLESRR